MYRYIGLILIVLAVAAVIYVVSHTDDLLQLKLPLPAAMQPVVLPVKEVSKPRPQVPEIVERESQPVVRINSIKWPTSSNAFMEIVLRSDLKKDETVDITGWTIKSNYGLFRIPQAQEIYAFNGPKQDIVLHYRDKARLFSGQGPKGNFRLNKCMGYIGDVVSFTPSIPKTCPRILRSEIDDFSGYGQDYLLSLKTCENPLANPPVPHDDFACFDYLKTLNYAGCVEKYKDDDDFLSDEWWVWLDDKINIFDRVHDKVQLLDKEGNVVDEYRY